VSQHGICNACHEELNMYGGCRCNGYTTAFNAVENQHIPQHSNGAEPAEITPFAKSCAVQGTEICNNLCRGCPYYFPA
jgi:murein tripeptide amidase MpaA